MLLVPALHGQSAPDLHRFEEQARGVFSPAYLLNPSSGFLSACDNVMLLFQALAVLLVLAGLLQCVRREHGQLEGIASILLKVAFIATLPTWRGLVLDTADLAANAIGYRAAATAQPAPTMVSELWGLLGQWMPPSSPYLDALQTQSETNAPASGDEERWAEEAWNWARGITAASDRMFDGMWQAVSGGVRATIVFGTCALMTCAVALALMTVYLGEILRIALFFAGVALAPLFIAGLGLEAWRTSACRFLLRLGSVAFWPVIWALTGLVTAPLIRRTTEWMHELALAAPGVASPATVPPFAVVAPFMAWGSLFLTAVVGLVICLLVVAGALIAPVLVSRFAASGARLASPPVAVVPASVGAAHTGARAVDTQPPSHVVIAPSVSVTDTGAAERMTPRTRRFSPPPAPARHRPALDR